MPRLKLTTPERLTRGAAVLDTLEYCREITHRADLGATIERIIVGRELSDLQIVTRIEDVDEDIERVKRAVSGSSSG